MERLYTVEDVAQMTGLTDRTIRTYLKTGKLLGRKIGVQWRFTQAQVEALFRDADVTRDIKTLRMRTVDDFLHRTDMPPTPEACAVVDWPSPPDAALDSRVAAMTGFLNAYSESQPITFSYQYDATRGTARFILTARPRVLSRLLSLLEEESL